MLNADMFDPTSILGLTSKSQPPPFISGEAEEQAYTGYADTSEVPEGSRALLYLRVSSEGQVKTDYDPQGNSIPTQRTSCFSAAESLNLTVVGEYVEPGRSATEITKRKAFRDMIARIQTHRDVDYVIVYKFSRAARNQWEDAVFGILLQKLGVKLISATEPISDSAAGKAMRGMISVFNEYQSTASGEDIKYKMAEKAKRGGTIGKAPLGYLNAIDHFEDREIRTVIVDQERAPYIRLAFELYATGEYTLENIADELTDRGLLTKPTPKRPAVPISINKVVLMLRDPYYIGMVRYKGDLYPGRHEPIIDPELFDAVQRLADSRGKSGERRRQHHHFLKGTVYCGRCRAERVVDRRLIIQRSVGRHGNEYFYFFCPGTKDGTCASPHHSVHRVEEAVEREYLKRRLEPEFLAEARSLMSETLTDQDHAQKVLKKQIDTQLQTLRKQEENLLDLAQDGALDTAQIKSRLFRIKQERGRLTSQRDAVVLDLTAGARELDAELQLLERPYELYMNASHEVRRRLNQALFGRIYISDNETVSAGFNEPYNALMAAQTTRKAAETGMNEERLRDLFARALEDAWRLKAGNEREATQAGGLPDKLSQRVMQHLSELFTTPRVAGVSNSDPMVEPRGIEPRSTSTIPCLLRA